MIKLTNIFRADAQSAWDGLVCSPAKLKDDFRRTCAFANQLPGLFASSIASFVSVWSNLAIELPPLLDVPRQKNTKKN